MARHLREFGVSSVNLDSSIYNPFGRLSTPEEPLPESLNTALHEQREKDQASVIPEIAHVNPVAAAWASDFSFGPVSRPAAETWLAYSLLLRHSEGAKSLQFNPKTYGIFDRIIVKACGIDNKGTPQSTAFNPNHPFYEDFAPLRRNLALLRNYLLVTHFPDGKFEPGKEDKRNLAMVQQMAQMLGDALAGPPPPKTLLGRWSLTMKRLFTGKDLAAPDVSAFMQVANIPDRGAEMMYNYLLSIKNKPRFTDWLPFVSSPRKWPLPSIDQTPFSEANMQIFGSASIIEACANEIDRTVIQLRSLDTLSEDARRTSIEEAHKILRNLWKMVGSDATHTKPNVYSPDEAKLAEVADTPAEESRMMMAVIRAFKETIGDISAVNRDLLRNPALEEALNAIEMIGYRVKVEAFTALTRQGDMFAAKRMGERIQQTPPKFKTEIPLRELLTKLETGVNTAATIRQNIPPARLAEAQAQRAQSQAQIQAQIARQRAAQIARNRATATKTNTDVMARARVTSANNQQAIQEAERIEHARLLREQQMAARQNNKVPGK